MQNRRLDDIERLIRRMGGFRSKRFPTWTAVEVELDGQNYIFHGQRMTPDEFKAHPEIAKIPRLVVVELPQGDLFGEE